MHRASSERASSESVSSLHAPASSSIYSKQLYLPVPRPSFDHGRVRLRLSEGGKSLTMQQNERVAALERSLSAPLTGAPSSSAAQSAGGIDPARARRAAEAATEQRNLAFASALGKIEEMMNSMECTSGKAPEAVSGGTMRRRSVPAADDGGATVLTSKKEAQREAANRLFLGCSGKKMPKKLPTRELGPPPAKAVELRLKALRADPLARRALEDQVQVYMEMQQKKRWERARGKDFIAINVTKAARPRSAPPQADGTHSWAGTEPSSPVSPRPIAERPAWSPGGAPAYKRPGSERPGSAPPAPLYLRPSDGPRSLSPMIGELSPTIGELPEGDSEGFMITQGGHAQSTSSLPPPVAARPASAVPSVGAKLLSPREIA